jgi:hypothetical protein
MHLRANKALLPTANSSIQFRFGSIPASISSASATFGGGVGGRWAPNPLDAVGYG